MLIPEKINVQSPRARQEVSAWLQGFGLDYGADAQATFVLRQEEELLATGSRSGNVFKYFAVTAARQGENLSGSLLTALMADALSQGISHWFIFSAPEQAALFQQSGFQEIIVNPYGALLEGGSGSIQRFMDRLKESLGPARGTRGAIVMNLNPLTLGHLYLIEQARHQVDELVIFLVEEDLSVFPFKDRMAILQEAIAHMAGVRALPGGPYLISRATFPTYFLKRSDENLMAYTHTDAEIFGRYYAQALGISRRFVGEEPLDPVTAAYNDALKAELPGYGVGLQVIPRLEMAGGPISASRVRQHLARGERAQALALVPAATAKYLDSAAGKMVIARIQSKEGTK